jgi:hypothetical protein
VVADVLTVAFACIGGVLGYMGFVWLTYQGFYALVLPGGLAGLVAGIPQCRSMAAPILCCVVAIGAGLLAEYRFAPFLADQSLGYFFAHLVDLRPFTLLLIGLGGAIGFWVPFRRRLRE